MELRGVHDECQLASNRHSESEKIAKYSASNQARQTLIEAKEKELAPKNLG
jgi:hypothetical protein